MTLVASRCCCFFVVRVRITGFPVGPNFVVAERAAAVAAMVFRLFSFRQAFTIRRLSGFLLLLGLLIAVVAQYLGTD